MQQQQRQQGMSQAVEARLCFCACPPGRVAACGQTILLGNHLLLVDWMTFPRQSRHEAVVLRACIVVEVVIGGSPHSVAVL